MERLKLGLTFEFIELFLLSYKYGYDENLCKMRESRPVFDEGLVSEAVGKDCFERRLLSSFLDDDARDSFSSDGL